MKSGADEVAKFTGAWEETGKRLDMGKSCVRFKRLDDVPLDLVGKTIKRMTVKKFVKQYRKSAPRKKTKSKK